MGHGPCSGDNATRGQPGQAAQAKRQLLSRKGSLSANNRNRLS